ncbi:MAG: methylmalonyl-CoA mutase, partial [Deltaproteobacteria bacterium]
MAEKKAKETKFESDLADFREKTKAVEGKMNRTLSGLPLELLYTPVHFDAQDYDEKLGYPGSYPYTRGI